MVPLAIVCPEIKRLAPITCTALVDRKGPVWRVDFSPEATEEQKKSVWDYLKSLDLDDLEAAEQKRQADDAKAAPYRELAILKLAAIEAEAAGDVKAQEAIAKSVADLQA